MGVCLEVQFTPLEFEGFVRHLSSFLDVLERGGAVESMHLVGWFCCFTG